MSAVRQRRLTFILIGCAVVLALLWLALLAGLGTGVRWTAPRDPAPPPAGAARPAAAPAPSPTAPSFAAVWQQSLFSPERKPEAHGVSASADNGLALTGIILTPSLRMALLRDGSAQHEWRLREDQSSPDGSVTVVEVKPRAVVLDTAQGRIELPLLASVPSAAEPGESRAAPNPADKAGAPPSAAALVRAAPVQAAARYNPQQLETLRKLKAAVQKRRAASQAANEGVY